MRNPLAPDAALLCKIGSALVHADELLDAGKLLDHNVLVTLLNDEDVRDWIKAMGPLLPVKR